MPLNQLLQNRRARITRPESYSDLLLEPIVDGGQPLTNWASIHNSSARFRTTGMVWFQQATGMTNKWLSRYLEEAKRFIPTGTKWAEMPDALGHWKTNPAPGQLTNAVKGQPMIFAKAAQIIVTCELALKAQMENPRPEFRVPAGFTSPEQIYGYMAVYAAVWNINGFTEEYVKAAETAHATMRNDLMDAAGVTTSYIVTDLTKGFCVTREVAEAMHAYAVKNLPVEGHHLDRVRAKPGAWLGSKSASKNEDLVLSLDQ